MNCNFKYVLLAFLLSFSSSVISQEFLRNINTSNGLSSNFVNAIYRDTRGVLWIGTNFGLNMYDGYRVKTYNYDPLDKQSICDNYVDAISGDCKGMLWLHTRARFSVFDSSKQRFDNDINARLRKLGIYENCVLKSVVTSGVLTGFVFEGNHFYIHNYLLNRNVKIALGQRTVLSLAFEGTSYAWIVDNRLRIYKIDVHAGKVVATADYKGPAADYYKAIMVADGGGGLWMIMNEKWLLHYDTVRNQWRNFQQAPFSKYPIYTFTHKGREIYIGTDHGGIYSVDQFTFQVKAVSRNADKLRMSDYNITRLYTDRDGIVWIGTYKHGLYYAHQSFGQYNTYRIVPSDYGNDINCFARDANDNLWIGTNGNGLYFRASGSSTYKKIQYNDKTDGVVVSLCCDSHGRIWLGTFLDGLYCINHGRVQHFDVPGKTAWSLASDSFGRLWIGTLTKGLYYMVNGKMTPIQKNYEIGNTIECIRIEGKDRVLVGGCYGFYLLNSHGHILRHFTFYRKEDQINERNTINCILRDRKGYYWICTQGGLAVYDIRNVKYHFFKKEDGIPQQFIYSAQEDKYGNIWVSSSSSIYCIRMTDYDGLNHISADVTLNDKYFGLQDNIFNNKCSIISRDGIHILFGGLQGYTEVYQRQLASPQRRQKIAFTDLFINNHLVMAQTETDGHVILDRPLWMKKKLSLHYDENNIKLNLSSLDLLNAYGYTYEYKLDGVDKQWNTINAREPSISLINLPSGTYHLLVRAFSHTAGSQVQTASLFIQVHPPFWLTWEAYVVYILLISAVVAYAFHNRVKHATMLLNMQHEQQERSRIEELSQMKMNFFTSLSHELRTPVSLILLPIETLIAQEPEWAEKHNLKMVLRNAKRLLYIVNQLLDFRKIEAGKFPFNPLYGDIVAFVKDNAMSFSDLSQNKSIKFVFTSSQQELYMNFDPNMMERIIFNLLSNAFKFTARCGEVGIRIKLCDGASKPVTIEVYDTGTGIPEDDIAHIFNPYFQAGNQHSVLKEGTGIGLSVVHQFVKQHNGDISVRSSNAGTVFTMQFEIGEKKNFSAHVVQTDSEMTELIDRQHRQSVPKEKTVLVVDDNDDFRYYIVKCLKDTYNVIDCENGQLALDKANLFVPDIIVSDIMMPVMDGIELCKCLKADKRTAHIPVVLLTASISDKNKIEGYDVGASGYITKPFSISVLQSRISNLLNGIITAPVDIQEKDDETKADATPSVDDKILHQVETLTNEHMNDADFSIEWLSREVGMSTVYLNKKISVLTGKTSSEFVRQLKMKKACCLLTHTQMSISEIAYDLGYSFPKYFSKHFKEEYGVLPTQYRKNIH
jgi:signal transduction histidine kinase/ligand-binding sensor domain-containing protein/DNA-binding response OmpR family regulator